MRWKNVAVGFGCCVLSSCGELVPETYEGEPRLSLSIGVLNNTASRPESVVPALAYIEGDSRVRFRPVSFSGAFPADFQVDVKAAPSKERFVPVDPFLAPDVMIVREYLGAVIAPRLDEPIELNTKVIPVHPDCWQGRCDFVPGQMALPCEQDDAECVERQRDCPNGTCQTMYVGGPVLPDGVEDVTGFAADYMVLYVAQRIRAGSWAAHKLNAPNGLEPGFHLTIRLDPDGEAGGEEWQCLERAHADAFASFNAKHGTAYDDSTVSCLDGTALTCDSVAVPDDDAIAEELAQVLSAAEVEQGCLELAPTLEYVRDPADKRILVKMRTQQPDWFPTVPPMLPPLPGLEEVECEGAKVTDWRGEIVRAAPTAEMIGYSGDLCPPDSLTFIADLGAFSVVHSSEEEGARHCEMSFKVTVPPGLRFRNPVMRFSGFTYREAEEVSGSRISITYAVGDSEPKSSHHFVIGLPIAESLGDFYYLVDTPRVTTECNDSCEPRELDLKVNVHMDTPPGAFASFDIFEADFEYGVEWATCRRDFASQ
jgi:hypothetical protein